MAWLDQQHCKPCVVLWLQWFNACCQSCCWAYLTLRAACGPGCTLRPLGMPQLQSQCLLQHPVHDLLRLASAMPLRLTCMLKSCHCTVPCGHWPSVLAHKTRSMT